MIKLFSSCKVCEKSPFDCFRVILIDRNRGILMFGVIYLITAILLGWKISVYFLEYSNRSGRWNGNRIWLYIPASIGTGVLLMGWVTYLAACAVSLYGNMEQPLIVGNVVAIGAAVAILVGMLYRDHRKGRSLFGGKMIANRRLFIREAVFFVLMLMFLNWIFFYVFHIIDGRLYSGFTVFGDYAPHTAMMRSFSWENNYPTQYPHFGGEDVKYHFMFQFLVGNLEFLGMRLDAAYNVLSLLVLEGFMMLLYILTQRVVKSTAAGIITIFLFFGHSMQHVGS